MAKQLVTIYFDGSPLSCDPSKSILDNLLDNNVKATFSCKKGTCLTCVLRTSHDVPKKSQDALKPALVEQGYFLSCQTMPVEGMEILPSEQNDLFIKTTVKEIKQLSGHVAQIFLTLPTPCEDFNYRPGQFLNIKNPDGEVRSYSIASTQKQANDTLEIHVKKHQFGKVSNWLGEQIKTNDEVEISGPNGDCFYINDQPEQPLLLIGTGTGLAPLLGVVRQALSQNHTGDIKLYHGAVEDDGLYLTDELKKLSNKYSNVEIHLGTLKQSDNKNISCGSINDIALTNHPELKGWKIYLCGDPQMVQTTKQKAFLSGANLADIFSDPFEMKTPLTLD